MAKKAEIENEEVNVEAEENTSSGAGAPPSPQGEGFTSSGAGAPPSPQGEGFTSSVTPAYDPWKDMRQVYIPKRTRGEQNTLEVGVNDRTYFIPKEKWVEVPEPVWEVISEMQARQKALDEYLDKNDALTQSQGKA